MTRTVQITGKDGKVIYTYKCDESECVALVSDNGELFFTKVKVRKCHVGGNVLWMEYEVERKV